MAIAAVGRLPESEPKPLGTVRLDCRYPVVSLALKEILGDKADVYEGREQAPERQYPSSVILCSSGEDYDVLSEVRRLRCQVPGAAVLVFDMRPEPHLVEAARRAGASGFLHAGMHPEQIIRALRLASEGRAALPDGPPRTERTVTEGPAVADLKGLTPRQRQILELVCEGLSNAQIAQRLFLTESTVKQHLHAAYKLLEVRSRVEAVKRLRGV